MGRVPQVGMVGEGGIGMGKQLHVQRGILIGRNRCQTPRRRLRRKVSRMLLLRQQPFDRAAADAKGLHDLLARHPPRHRRQHALPKIN